jgi:hypothetical protein
MNVRDELDVEGVVGRRPTRPPARADTLLAQTGLGDFSPVGLVALQRAVGNRGVGALLGETRRAAPVFHASPRARAIAMMWPSHAWHDRELQRMIENVGVTLTTIEGYIDGLPGADRNWAVADLQFRLDDYADTFQDGVSRLRALRRNPAIVPPDRARLDEDVAVDHLLYLLDVKRRIEAVLSAVNAETARAAASGVLAPETGWGVQGHAEPAAFIAGTHAPTASERRAVREGSAPHVEVDPHTGHPLPFQNTVPGTPDPYGTRIRKALLTEISDLHHSLVDNRGAAQRGSVISWARYEDMAVAAKKVVDATFGSYARRPQLVHDVNLIDLWESRGLAQSHMTPSQRTAEAKELVNYLVKSSSAIRTINAEHHADPTRNHERAILATVANELAQAHTQELQEINRGWEGEQDPDTHRIFMQRWPEDPAGDTQHIAQRRAFWDTFEIFMHEYLHSLTSKKYGDFAQALDPSRENTFTEGMTSVMTEIAFSNANPQDPALRQLVEGSGFAALPFDSRTLPDVWNRRYPSYDQAMHVVKAVGIKNVYAAYFLGHVDLIKPGP